MNIILKAIGILIVINLSNCQKEIEKCPRFFTLPVNISPVKDVYNIGDTLRIVSEFSNQLVGLNIEGKEIGAFDMTGIRWRPVIRLLRLDTIILERDSHISNFNDVCVTNFIKGDVMLKRFSSGNESIYGEYDTLMGGKEINLDLILLKKGIYYLEFFSDNNIGSFGFQDYSGVCGRDELYVYFKTNSGADNNFHFMQESPDPYWNTPGNNFYGGEFKENGGFCFKVE